MKYEMILFSRSSSNQYMVKQASSLKEAQDLWTRFTGGGKYNTDTTKGHYYRMMAIRSKKRYDVTKIFTDQSFD